MKDDKEDFFEYLKRISREKERGKERMARGKMPILDHLKNYEKIEFFLKKIGLAFFFEKPIFFKKNKTDEKKEEGPSALINFPKGSLVQQIQDKQKAEHRKLFTMSYN